VLRGRRHVSLGGPKPRALLVTLALVSQSFVSVDRIVEHLWPARPSARRDCET
jgi:DNA-binding SARP family transcriptional activator